MPAPGVVPPRLELRLVGGANEPARAASSIDRRPGLRKKASCTTGSSCPKLTPGSTAEEGSRAASFADCGVDLRKKARSTIGSSCPKLTRRSAAGVRAADGRVAVKLGTLPSRSKMSQGEAAAEMQNARWRCRRAHYCSSGISPYADRLLSASRMQRRWRLPARVSRGLRQGRTAHHHRGRRAAWHARRDQHGADCIRGGGGRGGLG